VGYARAGSSPAFGTTDKKPQPDNRCGFMLHKRSIFFKNLPLRVKKGPIFDLKDIISTITATRPQFTRRSVIRFLG
jgi:hypothetical protein